MSIKNLFGNKVASIENATTASNSVESKDYILTRAEKEQTFQPYIDFASASNFVKFGSAKEYYKKSIERIYDQYPYDGSDREKILFDLSSSYLDRYILEKRYPKTNGYISLSYGGWGTLNSSKVDGYGLPTSTEYIYLRGGIHTASGGMENKSLYKTFDKSIKYDSAKGRTTSLRMNIPSGFTTEFWLKKDAFDTTKTEKEVIFDLWNGEASSSADYGRFTLALSGTTSGEDIFIVTLQSGSSGFYEQTIGTSTVTTSSLSSWHHYAFSFVSASGGITSRLYLDGDLNEQKTLGSTGLNEIGGLINGYIGALQTSPSGSSAAAYSGKLSASLDDFRFWKTRRTSQQIYNNWYTHVGGGTNTDEANTNLGVYYKFNEGIVGNSTTDSIVLDYSGRLVNGSWTGYSSGARSTSSAFTESGLVTSEPKDYIIYSAHPDVSSLKTELETSGDKYDRFNTGWIYNKIPQWIRDEDNNGTTKELMQIMASYFDTIYTQITALPALKNKVYPSSSYEPVPFSDRLLMERGLVVPNLFVDSKVIEAFGDRDANQVSFEKNLNNLKNQIYTNIYNNLEEIYKSKGTESSIRNMLRCFGFDDELVKLNVYTDGGKHYFTDKAKHTSLNKKFVDFNNQTSVNSTLFQTSSTNHTISYLSGSQTEKLEQYNALSSEINIIVPQRKELGDSGYFFKSFLSSSIFGMHQATTSSADYTWDSPDLANFQVYLVRDERESGNAKFVCTDYAGNFSLETDVFKEIYSNEKWNLAVRIKPEDYPFAGNVVTSSNRDYTLEFYGVSHAFDTVKEEFSLSTTLNYTTGSAYLSNPKRFYIGAHRTNYTGSVLQSSDVKVGRFGAWLDYIDDGVVKQHNLDISNKGNDVNFRPSTAFTKDLSTIQIPSNELSILNWDFETVTTSDGSGEFIVEDTTSGSADTRYGWIDNIIRREHRGKGYGFDTSSTDVVSNEIIFTSQKELPEISYTSDGVTIKGETEEYFVEDEDVSDNFYALEKSMYQAMSEEMLKMFSTMQDYSNLIGEAVERYRLEYKKLNYMRRLFFEDVENDPDFDRFTEYFKWIDSSVSYMISQIFPLSARFSNGISDVVESHILERNKYQNKFPLIQRLKSTEGTAKGSAFARYMWKFGHAPLSGDDNDNCLWQRERKERTIADKETIRKVIVNDTNGTARNFAQSNGTTYEGSTYALRRLSRPYKISQGMQKTVHGGTNYSLQKDRDYVYATTNRHSPLTSIGVPINVLVVGAGTGQGIELPRECNDVEDPNLKKKFNVTMYVGKESSGAPGGSFAPINDSASYNFAVKGEHKLPFNIVSGNIDGGYNSTVVSGYRSDAVFTNIHSDTTHLGNDIPLQGPFTQTWVGGHQSRHQEINRYDTTLIDGETLSAPPNNLHNLYTRAESWRLVLVESGGGSDGAFGLVDSQYGVTAIAGHPNNGKYPDVAKKSAVYYRDLRTKRPVNIANIRTEPSSYNHGNFRENYNIISAGGKHENNLFFRDNSDQTNYLASSIIDALPQTTNPMTLIAQDPTDNGSVFGKYDNSRQPASITIERVTASADYENKTIITSRFSAPGGIEVQSYGYLDAYSQEYSVYNSINYRNLTVRGASVRTYVFPSGGRKGEYRAFGGSGEDGTIRTIILPYQLFADTTAHKAILTRHCAKFGLDSYHNRWYQLSGSTTLSDANWDNAPPSYYKQQRNISRRPSDTSTIENPDLIVRHDNMFINSPIPKSDFQYKWINNSLGSNYSITSGKQRMYGYAHPTGILSSSVVIDGDSGFVPAITFPTASEIFGE